MHQPLTNQDRTLSEYLSRGVPGVHLLYDALQGAVLGKDEGAAEGAQHRAAVHLLLAPGAKGLKHLRGRVRQQAERQLVARPEACVGLCRVLAKITLAQKKCAICQDHPADKTNSHIIPNFFLTMVLTRKKQMLPGGF